MLTDYWHFIKRPSPCFPFSISWESWFTNIRDGAFIIRDRRRGPRGYMKFRWWLVKIGRNFLNSQLQIEFGVISEIIHFFKDPSEKGNVPSIYFRVNYLFPNWPEWVGSFLEESKANHSFINLNGTQPFFRSIEFYNVNFASSFLFTIFIMILLVVEDMDEFFSILFWVSTDDCLFIACLCFEKKFNEES